LVLLIQSIIFYVVFSSYLGHASTKDLDLENSTLQSHKKNTDILTYCGLGFCKGEPQLALTIFYFVLYLYNFQLDYNKKNFQVDISSRPQHLPQACWLGAPPKIFQLKSFDCSAH
jgi:hypothetical protein